MVIDPYGAELQRRRQAFDAAYVPGENGSSQAVLHVIGQVQCFRLTVEFLQGDHGAEDFILDNLLILLHICEDGRLEVVAFFETVRDAAARENFRALRFCPLHKATYAFALDF